MVDELNEPPPALPPRPGPARVHSTTKDTIDKTKDTIGKENDTTNQTQGSKASTSETQDSRKDNSKTDLTPTQKRALLDILTHYQTYAEFEGASAARVAGVVGDERKQTQQDKEDKEGKQNSGDRKAKEDSGDVKGKEDSGDSDDVSVGSFETAKSNVVGEETEEDVKKEDKEDTKGKKSNEDQSEDDPPCPLINLIHRDFITTFPGLKNLDASFWDDRFLGIVGRWNVTASYDKGALGLRGMLTTLTSAVVEGLARARLVGIRPVTNEGPKSYNPLSARDVNAAWDEVVHGIVYGDLVDQLTDALATTDRIDEYSPAVGLAVQHAIAHLAALLHRVYVLCPEGQLLLQLIDNAHSLTPYNMIKQVLRVSTPSALMSGLTKLLLAKMSITALSNWAGLTNSDNDGMNLLQRIVATVLAWDAKEFRKAAERVEKAKNRPPSEMLARIRSHAMDADRTEQARVRRLSEERSESIIVSILGDGSTPISADHHDMLLSYLSNLLSVRDRTTIADALTRTTPDLFTGVVRDVVAAFDPMLRTLHSNLDVRAWLDDAQAFVDDFVACTRVKEGKPPPTAADFVAFLTRHRGWMFKWLHRLVVACPDITDEFRTWGKTSVKLFRGGSPMDIEGLWDGLSEETRAGLVGVLDSHAAYLGTVEAASLARLQAIIDVAADGGSKSDSKDSNDTKGSKSSKDSKDTTKESKGSQDPRDARPETPKPKKRFVLSRSNTSTPPPPLPPRPATLGPGVFLAKGQALLDDAPITPALPTGGPVRRGRDVREGGTRAALAGCVRVDVPRDEAEEVARVDVGPVVAALGGGFVQRVQSFMGSRSFELF